MTVSQTDSMIKSLEKDLAANPGYADLRNQLGLLYTLKGQFEEAREQFQQALVNNPYYLEARMNLAFLYMQEKDWEEAEGVLRECLEIEPEDSLCNHTLGVVLLIQGNRVKAMMCFEEAAQLDSFYQLQYKRVGALRGQRIILDGPTERKLIRRGKNQHLANLHNSMGQCYTRMERFEMAFREFRKASRIDANDYRAQLNIGKLYDLQRDYLRAIEQFERVLHIFPHCGMAYAHMAYAYAAIGDLKRALVSLKKAVKIHPHYADLRYQLGLLYQDLEMYPEAIDELKRALQLNPEYHFARMNLGDLYERVGRCDKALEQYERVAGLFPQDRNLLARINRVRGQSGSAT